MIKRIGPAILARAKVRAERFPLIASQNVIAAIYAAGARQIRTLAVYATTDPDEIVSGCVKPILKLFQSGVDMTTCDEYFGWPWGEAMWSAYHEDDLGRIRIERRTKPLLEDWAQNGIPGWEPLDRGSQGLSLIRSAIAPDGEDLIVEVSSLRIAIYAADLFHPPALVNEQLALEVPHYSPPSSILTRYIEQRVASEARYVMRWYRRMIYDLVLAEARTALL